MVLPVLAYRNALHCLVLSLKRCYLLHEHHGQQLLAHVLCPKFENIRLRPKTKLSIVILYSRILYVYTV